MTDPIRWGVLGAANFARAHMAWPAETLPPDSLYTGRLVLLVDESCHSACEDFAMPFKDNGRAIVIGQGDVRAVQLGKAALRAGIEMLLKERRVERVDRILLAGTFGSYIEKYLDAVFKKEEKKKK